MDKKPQTSVDVVIEALDTVRSLLGMDVSYVSEALDDKVHFRHVSGGDRQKKVVRDQMVPLTDMYCGYIAKGELPQMVGNTDTIPLLKGLRFTQEAQIKSLISVPINRSDGSLYGMFCCFSHQPKPSLNQRDLKTVRLFASLASRSLNEHIDAVSMQRAATKQVSEVIDHDAIETYFQPIVSLSDKTPMAVEALSRFPGQDQRDPMFWFDLAGQADMSLQLELAAIKKAVSHLGTLPDRMYMTVNASPDTLKSPELLSLLRDVPADRLVVELTEHQIIDDLPGLTHALDALRERRIGIAIDDVGAGYAGLTTVLGLHPNVLKLDRSLVSHIENSPAKQSLVKAMVYFANETKAFLVAEGVERGEEHDALLNLGVRLGQGFLYQRPHPAALITPHLHVQRQHILTADMSDVRAKAS